MHFNSKKSVFYWIFLLLVVSTFLSLDKLDIQKSLAYESLAKTPVVSNELPYIEESLSSKLTVYSDDMQNDMIENCKAKLAYTLSTISKSIIPENLNVELQTNVLHRGLANSSIIFMDCRLSQSSFTEVFWHELAHIHYFQLERNGTLNRVVNPFENRVDRHNSSGQPNYITDYAVVNEQEDFADSFAMYLKDRNLFKEKAKKSPILQSKYDFVEKFVMN